MVLLDRMQSAAQIVFRRSRAIYTQILSTKQCCGDC